jgi:glycosyltransferase involved in cell wall biosynthesis
LIRRIKELNPDVIHLHNIHGYYLNIEVLFSFLRDYNKPVVWTLHDCWAFTGHCAYFDYANCEQWRTHCTKCPEKKSYPKSFALDNSSRNFDRKKRLFSGIRDLSIVTPSEWLSDLVGESFLSNYPRRVINNGIDLEVFKPTKGDFRNKRNLDSLFIILGVAAGWNRRKGLETFLELSRELSDNEKIVLVGLTSKQKKTLPANILGIERTNSAQELAEMYSASDVFLNPTLEDNFPTTNLEAMACGTPVITYRTGGSPETIDEKCGFVVGKGDFKSLCSLLDTIRSRGKEEYSVRCKDRAKQKFNARNNYRKYLSLYGEL